MAYERMLGWHTPALRRAAVVAVMGVLAGLLLSFFVRWELALIGGWDVTALGYLGAVWPVVIRADGPKTRELAGREDDTRALEAALLIGASVTSLLGVGLALFLAGRAEDLQRVVLIALSVTTVVLSWFVVNTVYTLKYAQLDGEQDDAAVDFESPGRDQPTYRDFAYLAFTIGMTYQVSDTTLRSGVLRRTVLAHGLLSYLFGVVIVAGAINLIAGLVR